jgi:hypothetical protein
VIGSLNVEHPVAVRKCPVDDTLAALSKALIPR